MDSVIGSDGKTVVSSTVTPTDGGEGGPIIQERVESKEYEKDLQIVLGTAFGVILIVGLVVLAAVLYRISRHRRQIIYRQNDVSLDSGHHINIDMVKSPPTVLLLYSPDCPLHIHVVEALAGFLTEACGVTVTFDLWEEAEVAEQGVESWLVERLQEAEFILVVCSVGARLRCSKKKIHFKTDDTRPLPDYFAVAVDYVAEKLRAERQKGLGSAKFLTVYMEYSTPQDIPHQLEASSQFCLIRDISSLLTHLSSLAVNDSTKSDSNSQVNVTQGGLDSETGEIFKATLEQAKIFFKDNPAWMDEFIAQIEAPFWSLKRSRRRNKRRGEVKAEGDVSESLLLSQAQILQNNCQDFTQSNLNTVAFQDNRTSNFLKCGEYFLDSIKKKQCRQNSLPSSLSSSCGQGLSQQACLHLTKSLDSVRQGPPPIEGNSCLFCGCIHTEDGPVCRSRPKKRGSDTDFDLQSSSFKATDSFSLAHNVLQAEVHQEWGPNSPERLPRWQQDKIGGKYQDRESRHITQNQPCSSFSRLSKSIRPEKMFDCLYRNPSTDTIGRQSGEWEPYPTFSRHSFYSDDSTSLSDCDSLQRDLRSVQHISSFQDFVNSTTFTHEQRLSKAQTNVTVSLVPHNVDTSRNPLS